MGKIMSKDVGEEQKPEYYGQLQEILEHKYNIGGLGNLCDVAFYYGSNILSRGG